MKVDAENLKQFRNALGGFPTGVTVITAMDDDNKTPVGMTVSSFNTVSLEPPLILWSITRTATYYPIFEQAEHFCVNVLAADQQNISNYFASEGDRPFDGIAFTQSGYGAPLFSGCVAHFECNKWNHYDGGDHLIIVGEVTEFERWDRTPLVFSGGRYRDLAAAE